MVKIIFFILPFFVFNFYEVYYYSEDTNLMDLKYFQRINGEYLIIYINSKNQTNFGRVNATTLGVINYGRLFYEEIKYYLFLENNYHIYIFNNYLITEKNRQRNKVILGGKYHEIHDIINSEKSILIGIIYDNYASYKYDAHLYLLKEPYNKTSLLLTIENAKNFKLIGLKDYFIFIKIGEEESSTKNEVIYTFYILDQKLLIKNSLAHKYAKYSEIKFSELSEYNRINEFIMCIHYFKSITECKIITCKNNYLNFTKTYKIFSTHDDNKINSKNFFLYINIFDIDKIGCYLLSRDNNYKYDYVTIMQYKNNQLYDYKNLSDARFESIRDYARNYKMQIIKNGKDIAIITSAKKIHFIYFSAVYFEKTITLNVSETPNEFPIKEFIFSGIETLFHFSFEEIPRDLKIYKNSIEVETGTVFNNLNNFTYILEIEHYFKNLSLKIKDHEDDNIYNININITSDTYISTYMEKHKCFKSKLYNKINNIKYSNLYNIFQIENGIDYINITFTMESIPLLFETIFYLNNYTLNCTYDSNNITTCKIPLIIIPFYEIIHIYSFLSCYNLIDVGWFQIKNTDILGVYDLLAYNFDFISKIYNPSEIITEYNSKMINYYYWFSCLAYNNINNFGPNNYYEQILSTWKIIFSKEYRYDNALSTTIIDSLDTSFEYNLKNKELSASIFLIDIIKKKNKEIEEINTKGYKQMKLFTTAIFTQFLNFFYRYNFIILKNDEYKKIVVAFPGLTYNYQLFEEIIHAGMVELSIKEKSKVYRVIEMYYDLFTLIENDLFEHLRMIPEINNKDYQVIFTGHSLGGAIATISSFYYIKKYKFEAENILITFGQPKVGNEHFSKELTDNLRQIYRIARPRDIATLFPFKEVDLIFQLIKLAKFFIGLSKFILDFISGNIYTSLMSMFSFLKDDYISEYLHFIISGASGEELMYYSHIGVLYMLDDDSFKVFHCDDFKYGKGDDFICNEHKLKITSSLTSDFYYYRNYLFLNQSSCYNNKMENFRFNTYSNGYRTYYRRLEIINNIRNRFNNNYYYYNNIQGKRKLNNIEYIQENLILFKKINFEKNKNEFFYKYESNEKLNIKDLILVINPNNKHFFGEICLSQNITWLNNNEFDLINCYFINYKNPFSVKINLKKEIIDEKILYLFIKGKISGDLELYDLSKNKTLNLSTSYYIPYIDDFPTGQSINFILPKLVENIYINIIINDYGYNQNNTISPIFEIYCNNKKINYEMKNLMLEKQNEYYFKYYPNQYELILNFIPIYSNNFLSKQFYIIGEQNISINYNIESKKSNQSFGLFFDFNEALNIKGYYANEISNITNNEFNLVDYILNINDKFFNLTYINKSKYLNLDINLHSPIPTKLIIYEIEEVIIINKINSMFEINKNKNYIFLLDEIIQNNYIKFESYIFISINNSNNTLKLILTNGDIISSKNYLIVKIYDIKSIFIKSCNDDILMIKFISEEISKLMNEESDTFSINTLIDNKKYSIDFIHNDEEVHVFYNSISNNLKIYEINNESYFKLDELKNNKMNYSSLLGITILEEQKTHMILKESSGQFLYEKYINSLFIDLNYILEASKICYLFMDFEYIFSYNRKIKKIRLKVLNNDHNQTPINFICKNEVIEIKDIAQIDVEKCNGTFYMSGNNSLIYFYLPLTLNESNIVIDGEDNFELLNVYQFFFIPKKNDFDSINILLTLENKDNDYPIYFTYQIEYGIIPFSRNIMKKNIFVKNETNIILPNYSNYSTENEKYFIYFIFNTTISKLNIKVTYENIIYIEVGQTYLILKPGINIIKFRRNIDYYLKLTKFNKNSNNLFYSVYKNNKIIDKNIINDTNNIIFIEESSYNENIKLKIENDDDILILISEERFKDFSFILYEKNFDIEQIENNLIIKFNTTNYKSKLEYQEALIDAENNIDPISIHKKFYENNLISKNTIYSTGITPIETSFTLNQKTFNYNKNYTIIVYGKDIYGNNFNYFYMEPKTFFISRQNNTNDSSKNTIIIEPSYTYIEDNESSDTSKKKETDKDDENNNIIKNSKKKNSKKTTIIVLACIGGVIIIALSIVLLFYCKKKKHQPHTHTVLNYSNSNFNIKNN